MSAELIVELSVGKRGTLPRRATEGSSGYDLFLPQDVVAISLGAHEYMLFDTDVSIAIRTPGWEAQVRPRSGWAARYGITVGNSPGTIDTDYRGTIQVLLINHGNTRYELHGGDRIAQLVFVPVGFPQFVPWTDDATRRGPGGFGSTGC